jgi:CRP-like cAMP-binding protein
MTRLSSEHGRLIRQLESLTPLTAEVREALADLPFSTQSVPGGVDVVEQGAVPTACCLVIEGLMCRYALTPSGGRQIVAFHIPGDLPDRDGMHLPHLDHAVASISPSRVAYIPHVALTALVERHPSIGVALWRDAVVDSGVFRQWLISVGRRTAKERIAHLICEMHTRMEALGLADGDHFSFPITQAQVGDALGLSAVHVNRSLQELRGDDLISWKGSIITIHDYPALRDMGDFDPAYLELRPLPRQQ